MTRNDRLYGAGPLPDPRSAAGRDRDRIIYTSAFQRLSGVTQVITAYEADVHAIHNRLAHTLEVAQLARRISQRLLTEQAGESVAVGGLDAEAAEAAALAHDLGHPPFGHAGEQELDRILTNEEGCPGGFEGNAQSFRIVTCLARQSENFSGLDLTRATLNGILKYPWFRAVSGDRHKKWGAYSTEANDFNFARLGEDGSRRRRSLEAEVMDWADDVAYAVHDASDFYRAGLVPLDRLKRDDEERTRFLTAAFTRWKDNGKRMTGRFQQEVKDALENALALFVPTAPFGGSREERAQLRTFCSTLIHQYVLAINVAKPTDRRRVQIEPKIRTEVDILKELTWQYVILRPSLVTLQHGYRAVIHGLFREYMKEIKAGNIGLLPRSNREQLVEAEEAAGSENALQQARCRIVSDLISGLTESQALRLHARLTGRTSGSMFEPLGH